ncbi:MAG: uncharacterized membrane protein YbhN (UPF0104 family) [Gammaproteobacteria bacterium]|jgi:uncharacterized membrane protein YbhN (UPF0104 family)
MSELMQTTTAAKARIITAFMICALGICIWVLSTVDTSDLIAIDQPSMFLYGVFSQAAVYAVYILAWQVNLTQCAIPTVSYHNSVVHCGIAFLGKYIPGKLGGLILRGATIHTRTPSTGLIIKATTIEQATMVHAGLIICALTWSYEANWRVALCASLLAFASFIAILFPSKIVAMARKFSPRCPRISTVLDAFAEDIQKTYFTSMAFMLIIWLLSALSLFFVLQSFSVSIPFDKALLITTVSFLTGFFAVILPAGIGAREGALIVLLAPYCNTLTALTVATLHRMITVSFDLLIGCYALKKLSRS